MARGKLEEIADGSNQRISGIFLPLTDQTMT